MKYEHLEGTDWNYMTPETYMAYVICNNCDYVGNRVIEKGILVIQATCPNCECVTLDPSEPRL